MAESIIFRGAWIRYFDGRQEEGGAFVRIHMTAEFTKPVMDEMGWEDPGGSITDGKLEGELHATHFVLTPTDLRAEAIKFDIRSVEDFKVVTIEKDEVRRRELRFVVRSSASDAAALVDGYIRKIGDHQGALKVSYTKQETFPLEPKTDDGQDEPPPPLVQAVMDGNSELVNEVLASGAEPKKTRRGRSTAAVQ